MRIRLRRPDKGDPDYELTFGVLFLTLLSALSFLALEFPDYVPGCAFHRLTGIPCPACGSLRCGEALRAGHFRDAWLAQPLATALAVLGAAFMLYSWIVVLLRLPRVRVEMTKREKRVAIALIIAAVAGNWAYLVIRM